MTGYEDNCAQTQNVTAAPYMATPRDTSQDHRHDPKLEDNHGQAPFSSKQNEDLARTSTPKAPESNAHQGNKNDDINRLYDMTYTTQGDVNDHLSEYDEPMYSKPHGNVDRAIGREPHVWHSLDPKSTSAMIERIPTHQNAVTSPKAAAGAVVLRGHITLGKLSKLPVELIRQVCEILHQADGPMTPLMLTCKRFADLIANMPRVWRRILVSVDWMPPSLQTGSTMSCSGQPFLERCLERARNAPLEITLVIGKLNEESPSAEVRAERFGLVLKKSRQVTFLCLIINPYTPIEEVVASFSEIFTEQTPFDNLESLMIASAVPLAGLLGAFRGLLEQINRTSTKLRSLYLENVSKEFIMEAQQGKFWENLARITLKGEYHPLHAAIFRKCHRLEFLSFTGELLAHPEETPASLRALPSITPIPSAEQVPASPSHIYNMESQDALVPPNGVRGEDMIYPAHLQWLRIGAISMHGLSHLFVPKLRYLVIQTALRDYTRSALPAHSIVLPELEVLHISTIHATAAAIVAPKLVTLCLSIEVLKKADGNVILRAFFDGHEKMLKPKNLTLTAPVHDKYLVEALKKLDTTESLTLHMQDEPTQSLLQSLKSKDTLRSIKSLVFDFQWAKPVDSPEIPQGADLARLPAPPQQQQIPPQLANMRKLGETLAKREVNHFVAKWKDGQEVDLLPPCAACLRATNHDRTPFAQQHVGKHAVTTDG